MERYEINEERQWRWQQWTRQWEASQQPAPALALNGFVSSVPKRLPTTVTASAAAVVIRYGEFGTEADGRTRK